jgi:hypothetical protein
MLRLGAEPSGRHEGRCDEAERFGVGGGLLALSVLMASIVGGPVGVGDWVRTDATGRADMAYGAGSRTRSDVDTEFDVVALTDDADEPLTRTALGGGRVCSSSLR